MKNIFESDKFDLQVIAQGACLDHLNDKIYVIETVTFRLNHVALNAWSDSEMMNSCDCYETDKEWDEHREKYKEKRFNVKKMILESLGMDAEPEQVSICRVVSEVFTAVYIQEIVGERENVMKRKKSTVWCYIDGMKHCDVVQWVLAANVTVSDAKEMLTEQYPGMAVTFKVI